MTKRRGLLVPVIVYTAIVILWEWLGRMYATPTSALIPPTKILQTMWEKRTGFWLNTLTTLGETLVGLALAIVLAGIVIFIVDRFRLFGEGLYRLALIVYSIPLIALAPALVAAVGLGIWSKIAIATLGAYFPIVVNVTSSLRSQDARVLELGKVLNLNYLSMLRRLRIQATLPDFFASLKIAAPAAFIAAIIAEWIGAESGLGLAMMHAMFGFDMPVLWAIMVIATAVNGLIVLVFSIVAQLATPWHVSSQGGVEV